MLFRPCVGVFVVFSALLLTFSACGDDKSSSANAFPDEVANKAELKTYECNMSIIGEKIFVNDLDKYYECDGDEWFESYDQAKSNAKDKSSSSSKKNSSSSSSSSQSDSEKTSSSKEKSSSSVKPNNTTTSVDSVFFCSQVDACDAMDKNDVETWKFTINDGLGEIAEYTYKADGRDLIVTINSADGTIKSTTYSMYNMESEAGVEMAFNAAKSTCVDGGGNNRITRTCKERVIERGTLKDERDGQTYKTVKIGDQWWMAENLAYVDSRYESDIWSRLTSFGKLYNLVAGVDSIKIAKEKKESIDCGKYDSLMCFLDVFGTIQGICPTGWHLPDTLEWGTLFKTIGGWDKGSSLKSPNYWQYDDGERDTSGYDAFGFSVLPTGSYYGFSDQNIFKYTHASFMTSSVVFNDALSKTQVASINFEIGRSSATQYAVGSNGISIRCIKDNDESAKKGWKLPQCNLSNQGKIAPEETMRYICDNGMWRMATLLEKDTYRESCTKSDSGRVIKGHLSDTTAYYCTGKGWADYVEWNWDVPKESRFNPNVKYGTLMDERDGKVYKTVDIDGQIWMAENLNYAGSDTDSIWCYENVEANCDVGGRLYSWFAAIDYKNLADEKNNPLKCDGDSICMLAKVRGICPEGWHLPNYVEFGNLKKLGMSIKSTTGWDKYWKNSNVGYVDCSGTNTTGFSAIPTGERLWYQDIKDNHYVYEFVYRSGTSLFLWTSSSLKENGDNIFYFEVGSTDIQIVATRKPLNSNNGYSVRCVKD